MNINNYTNLLVIITTLIIVYSLFKRNKFFLNVFRMERYNGKEYLEWLKNNRIASHPRKMTIPLIFVIIITSVFIVTSIYIKHDIFMYLIVFVWTILFLIALKYQKQIPDDILLFSSRLMRLIIFSFILSILEILVILSIYVLIFGLEVYYYPVILLAMTIIYYEVPYNILIANFLVKPLERKLYKREYNNAYDKITSFEDLTTIGIAGSVEKSIMNLTSYTILKEKYNVLRTDQYNDSIKDIIRIINEKLNRNHDIFIADVNSRKIGDIDETAKLIKPQIGIITGIEESNNDKINNIENTMKAKYEIIEALPAEGIAIFNYDNKYVKKLADKTFKEKILYGIEKSDQLDYYATDIKLNKYGTNFILWDKEGTSIECKTRLIGKDNILAILGAAALARTLGMSLKEIAIGVENIKPPNKKLELINRDDGILEINDRFITGPIETNKSIEAMSDFVGRKIIITPGFMDLRYYRSEENRKLGNKIAKTFDFVILVGKKQSREIYKGFLDEAFSKDKILIVNTMEEAHKKLARIQKYGDIILWENEMTNN